MKALKQFVGGAIAACVMAGPALLIEFHRQSSSFF